MTLPNTPTSTSHNSDELPETGSPALVDQFVDAVLDGGSEGAAVELLSDLSRTGVQRLQERWSSIPDVDRLVLVQTLAHDAQDNVERNYDRVLLVAFDDSEADTRLAAVEALGDLESASFLELILARIEFEEDDRVRAAQASALGRFVLLSEVGTIETADDERLREVLIRLAREDSALEVRRRALESAGGYVDDDDVSELIQDAYDSAEHEMIVSAIHAMGRQCAPRFLEIIHGEMESDEPEIRYEAAVAAGSIGSERSVLLLIDLLRDDDPEVRMAAIAALGAIGGQTAIRTLRTLTEDDSETIAEAAELALEEAQIGSSPFRPIL
jgi:HEAT repeat protein